MIYTKVVPHGERIAITALDALPRGPRLTWHAQERVQQHLTAAWSDDRRGFFSLDGPEMLMNDDGMTVPGARLWALASGPHRARFDPRCRGRRMRRSSPQRGEDAMIAQIAISRRRALEMASIETPSHRRSTGECRHQPLRPCRGAPILRARPCGSPCGAGYLI
jgi:hypothetical protein